MTETDAHGDAHAHEPEDRQILTCEQAIRLLAEYLDGELGGGSRGKLEEHLQRCRSCYSRHEFEKGLKEQVARLGQEPVRPEFRERIRGLVARFSAAGEVEDGEATEP